MSRTSRKELNRRAMQVMEYIQVKTDHRTGTVCLAMREMVDELGISRNCLRFTMQHLQRLGLVSKRERFLPNGGQLENEYALSDQGAMLLRRAHEGERMVFDADMESMADA